MMAKADHVDNVTSDCEEGPLLVVDEEQQAPVAQPQRSKVWMKTTIALLLVGLVAAAFAMHARNNLKSYKGGQIQEYSWDSLWSDAQNAYNDVKGSAQTAYDEHLAHHVDNAKDHLENAYDEHKQGMQDAYDEHLAEHVDALKGHLDNTGDQLKAAWQDLSQASKDAMCPGIKKHLQALKDNLAWMTEQESAKAESACHDDLTSPQCEAELTQDACNSAHETFREVCTTLVGSVLREALKEVHEIIVTNAENIGDHLSAKNEISMYISTHLDEDYAKICAGYRRLSADAAPVKWV